MRQIDASAQERIDRDWSEFLLIENHAEIARQIRSWASNGNQYGYFRSGNKELTIQVSAGTHLDIVVEIP